MAGRMLIPYAQDNKLKRLPASAASVVPVVNVAAAAAELAAGVQGVQLTCSTLAATGILDLDLDFDAESLSGGLGVELSDLVIAYAVTGAALTAVPTLVLDAVTFAAVGAAAAAPVVTGVAGITTTPGVLPTAISGAGTHYSAQFTLPAGEILNADLQKLVARLSVPLAVGGSFLFLGAFAHYEAILAQ